MTAPAEKPKEKFWEGMWRDSRWAAPIVFFAVIGLAGLLHTPWECGRPGPGETCAEAFPGGEDLANVTDTIFATNNRSLEAAEAQRVEQSAGGARAAAAQGETTNLLVAFEVLSVLLLAALIAGVVIALRERGEDR